MLSKQFSHFCVVKIQFFNILNIFLINIDFNIKCFRVANGLHTSTWSTHEHTSSANIQPMLLPRSTISLDKDHGISFLY